MPITDIQIRNAKPQDKPYKLADGGGLYLLVSSKGSKLWRMDYRFAGRRATASFGAYPDISLSTARQCRQGLKKSLADGIDPAHQKKLEKLSRHVSQSNTFKQIAAELLEKKRKEGKSSATLSKAEWLYSLVLSDLGDRPVSEISALEILTVLRRIEDKGNLETARRLRATIGQVFRFAIATARAENDPSTALRGAIAAPVVTHRAAITNSGKLGGLLRAIDGYDGAVTTRIALGLQILTFTRPGELRAAEWAEFDVGKATWTIPAARMKMRVEHIVPLSPQALNLLAELAKLTGGGKYLFPSERTVTRPISENTLNGALRRLGYTKEEVTSHGFRATFSTMANESGLWHPDVIERALAHADKNVVRKAYNRATHWNERVKLAAWWADRCDEMRQTANGGNVVPFAKAE